MMARNIISINAFRQSPREQMQSCIRDMVELGHKDLSEVPERIVGGLLASYMDNDPQDYIEYFDTTKPENVNEMLFSLKKYLVDDSEANAKELAEAMRKIIAESYVYRELEDKFDDILHEYETDKLEPPDDNDDYNDFITCIENAGGSHDSN